MKKLTSKFVLGITVNLNIPKHTFRLVIWFYHKYSKIKSTVHVIGLGYREDPKCSWIRLSEANFIFKLSVLARLNLNVLPDYIVFGMNFPYDYAVRCMAYALYKMVVKEVS